ncbi:hypothetical protein QJQ45_014954 [Haematococcus lacustris]|nr:hypothetical protein QJQ45_014954 [Haematococcus lacustris]
MRVVSWTAATLPDAYVLSKKGGGVCILTSTQTQDNANCGVLQVGKMRPATAKLKLLEQMQQRSQGAMKELSQYASSAPRMIDARMLHDTAAILCHVQMYSASVAAQHKLSEKLSEANVYIAHLEDKVSSHNEDLQAAAEVFKKVSMEFGTTGRLADAAVAAVRFGVDQEDAIAKVKKLRSRLDALELAMKRERENFSKRVPRKVPVTWVGAASEVRLVGDFDGWTRGLDLNNPDIESDSVLRTFEAVVPLLPAEVQRLRDVEQSLMGTVDGLQGDLDDLQAAHQRLQDEHTALQQVASRTAATNRSLRAARRSLLCQVHNYRHKRRPHHSPLTFKQRQQLLVLEQHPVSVEVLRRCAEAGYGRMVHPLSSSNSWQRQARATHNSVAKRASAARLACGEIA